MNKGRSQQVIFPVGPVADSPRLEPVLKNCYFGDRKGMENLCHLSQRFSYETS